MCQRGGSPGNNGRLVSAAARPPDHAHPLPHPNPTPASDRRHTPSARLSPRPCLGKVILDSSMAISPFVCLRLSLRPLLSGLVQGLMQRDWWVFFQLLRSPPPPKRKQRKRKKWMIVVRACRGETPGLVGCGGGDVKVNVFPPLRWGGWRPQPVVVLASLPLHCRYCISLHLARPLTQATQTTHTAPPTLPRQRTFNAQHDRMEFLQLLQTFRPWNINVVILRVSTGAATQVRGLEWRTC